MVKPKPHKAAYEVLLRCVHDLRRVAPDPKEAIEKVAELAAEHAPGTVREQFRYQEANEKLAKWARFTAKRVAEKNRDINEILLDLDEQSRMEGQSEESVKLLRGALGRERGEIVRSLLRAANEAETTNLPDHKLNERIKKAIIDRVLS